MPQTLVQYRPRVRALPQYTLSETDLGTGASLGNAAAWVNTKGSGSIERVFSLALGESLVGDISIRYAATGNTLSTTAPHAHETSNAPYVGLRHDTPGAFDIHPAYQRRRYSLAGAVSVAETTFVPLGAEPHQHADRPVAYQMIDLLNRGRVPYALRITGFARLRGTLAADVQARFVPELNALVAWNRSRPDAIRIFGLSAPPSRYATTFDFGSVYDPSHAHQLSNDTQASGDILGALQLDAVLGPRERLRLCFITGVYAARQAEAIAEHEKAMDYADAFERTAKYVQNLLQTARVLTPDPVINQGALWSKVNMHRVMADYPQGRAFTNEPGVSSNVVIRDGAWFVYGCDHFQPQFSRALLDKFAKLQYPDGKLPEYYNAIDGQREDDGLNINDDTPLFVLAVNHHYRATGDLAWLRRIYPAVAKTARYIISQRDERGLIYCSARDPRGNVWAIASWRNVIPLYSINGAVTEINAECAAALRAAGHLAEAVKRPKAECEEYGAASRGVRAAMDQHLVNPENGLYYLNIDVDGNVHTDVTGDEIFPVMLRVCDEDTGFRVISRLNSPDFWTPAGLRTVSRDDPMYDPSAAAGLIGGVWPGLTWWYAFAAARYHPEFMVRALRSSFEHYGANPKVNNTVPGQFSEWFDGESLVNRGQRLSPWEPPRFLWAAIEGVCGFMVAPGKPSVNPLVPAAWKWVGVRRLPYHGGELSYFAVRQSGLFQIYATTEVETKHRNETYEEDVSARVTAFSEAAAVVALRRGGDLAIMVGNVGSQTCAVPLNVSRIVERGATYEPRIYDSERDAWETGTRATGEKLCALAVSIETHGYRLIELRRVM
jgi:Amylo-alpha-1,6-glucosidase